VGKFIIEGGSRLKGEVTPSGNKNEALPTLAACLLTDEEVVLDNLPRIRDVEVMAQVLADLGASVEWLDRNRLRVRAADIRKPALDRDLCGRVRASILFAGPMLARMREVLLPPPGGDVIGRRKLDTHFEALKALGATLDVGDFYRLRARSLEGTEMFLDEASVTGTENAIMAATLASGTTVIENAACEPHVQNLCRMLVSMGARISGIGTNIVTIEGVDRLHGTAHRIGTDYLEVGSFIGLAAILGDGVTIHHANPRDLRKIRYVFEKLGVEMSFSGTDCFVSGRQQLRIRPDLNGAIPEIDDAPWPQYPTDLMSIAIVVATQASGTVLFFEKMFEGRMFFVDSLIGMGASIILCDPHRVVVAGPSRLYGTRLESPDVRAGMALLIAGLTASGRSTILNIRQIDRGYEAVDEKLRGLGARIERVEDRPSA
jgi:UDP-N-acetylglucosamine 1-carboxyvinyltransferase